MSIFIFQSRRDRYDLEREIKPGAIENWYATRYRDKMKPGDLVFFWLAGEQRGLYGWGRLVSEPYIKPEWTKHGVDVRYERKFKRPITADVLQEDPLARNLLILRAPQATNFLVEPDEVSGLRQAIKKAGEEVPPELEATNA